MSMPEKQTPDALLSMLPQHRCVEVVVCCKELARNDGART